jgi:hypothetical protein
MKFEAQAIAAQVIPITAVERLAIQKNKVPLAAKMAVTAFLAVLVPVYLRTYGPTNFLWFCDAALILTVAGMWLESSLLISMCAVGILLPQCLWLADFGSNLLGFRFLNLTSYMFDPHFRFSRAGFRCFTAGCPCCSSGFCSALATTNGLCLAWTVVAAGLMFVCYFFTPPAGAHLANPNIPINLNYLYGFNDRQPQHWVNQNLYVILWLGVLWVVAFLPTHLILRKIFAVPKPVVSLKLTIRFF